MCDCGKATRRLRRGKCPACYARWLRRQTTSLRDQRPPDERFWERVDMSGDCWLWLGNGTPHGYGQFYVNGVRQYAHRYVYELEVGPIPDGLTIDHLCGTRICVRPDHLEPVTRGENTQRGQTPRPCPHCSRTIVPANMPRHISARHASVGVA